jgi:uncharacterized membrane protein
LAMHTSVRAVVMPVLAHASWHLYRQLVGR